MAKLNFQQPLFKFSVSSFRILKKKKTTTVVLLNFSVKNILIIKNKR